MSIDATSGDPSIVAVGPSRIVKLLIRPMTKVLNPPIGKLAGRRHFPMVGQIHHVGRRSGKTYVTPVGVGVDGDIALIPLTFGNESDWVRNIRAGGECRIHANGNAYRALRPRFLTAAEAPVRTVFGPAERAAFRFLGIKQFLQLQVVAS